MPEQRSTRSQTPSGHGAGFWFLVAVVAILVIGAIMGFVVHWATDNARNSNHSSDHSSSAHVAVMTTSHVSTLGSGGKASAEPDFSLTGSTLA